MRAGFISALFWFIFLIKISFSTDLSHFLPAFIVRTLVYKYLDYEHNITTHNAPTY
jgi:Na+/proline symporter